MRTIPEQRLDLNSGPPGAGDAYQHDQLSQLSQPSHSRKVAARSETAARAAIPGMHAPWKIGFALARKFRALDPDADPNDLIPDIQREIPKGATDAEREAVTAEFVGAWPRVKYPEGFAGPLFDAYRAAMENPPPKAAKGLHSPVARNLLAFCEHLGRNGQFTLAQTAVARVMDVGQPEISRWLRYFRDHNWIRMEVEANHGHRQAAEYEWIADQEEST